MKLISLSANKPSFHTIEFKDGINIIVGKKESPENKNDGNTYNGVGKTLVIYLIHFCLGSNSITSLSQKLPDWEFKLSFEINGIRYYSKRSTSTQNIIDINGKELTLKEFRNYMFNLCFNIENNIKHISWSTLFSRFARKSRSCYSTFDGYIYKENDYSKLLNNCFLLGIDTDLIIKKKELRDRQTSASNTEKAIKNDPFFRQYYFGNHDSEIDIADLKNKIDIINAQISEFKVSKNYHEIEAEANELSYRKKELENRRNIVCTNILNIENALHDSPNEDPQKIINIYEEVNIELPGMVKNKLEDVIQFHKGLVENRNLKLKSQLNNQRLELKKINNDIIDLGTRMDELLDYLNSHGALEEYVALTKTLSSYSNELARIEDYNKILKSYKDTILNLKTEILNQDKKTDEYIENHSDYLLELMNQYSSFAKKFYPKKKSGLSIKNNSGENMLRYSMDARIEDDSSDGVNEVRIFCFDLLILLRKISNIRFLIHDSRLFANMDPRQRQALFALVNDICKTNDIQYICSINEDTLLSVESLMTEQDYTEIISNNIVLELKDNAPESKLLGIQIDIALND